MHTVSPLPYGKPRFSTTHHLVKATQHGTACSQGSLLWPLGPHEVYRPQQADKYIHELQILLSAKDAVVGRNSNKGRTLGSLKSQVPCGQQFCGDILNTLSWDAHISSVPGSVCSIAKRRQPPAHTRGQTRVRLGKSGVRGDVCPGFLLHLWGCLPASPSLPVSALLCFRATVSVAIATTAQLS